MNNKHDIADTEEAVIKDARRVSPIWLVPFVALLIGAWMVYYQWSNQGPQIFIEFERASGLEVGKTKIKFRDVVIGKVEEVELKKDGTGVIVTAAMELKASNLLRSDSKFWVVSPKVSLSGVSGLQTLLSGPYINIEPSNNKKKSKKFIGLENPPITPVGTPGLHIILKSTENFVFRAGDQIVYKGTVVGKFESVNFNLKERIAYYNVFIEAPFHTLITQNTKFWNASGLNFNLGANGIELQTDSIETLLSSGVTFGVPEGMESGLLVDENTEFKIFKNYKQASDERFSHKVYFVIVIEKTIRGLKVGAPVEYRGLEIGKVEKINLRLPDDEIQSENSYEIPVLISVQPGRAGREDSKQGGDFIEMKINDWVAEGLRASLKTGSLLTGAMYVDLQHYDNAPKSQHNTHLGYTIIPTIPDEIGQLAEGLNNILAKINALPLNDLSNDARSMMNAFSNAAKELKTSSKGITETINQFEARTLNDSLVSLNKLLVDYSKGSNSYANVNSTMQEFQSALKELTPLLQKLNSSPNSLVFKNKTSPNLEPRAAQ